MKDFKIWGFTYALIGDLIMGLPQLTYMEKKYPGSYKYWVILQKVSQCAPLFLNHPLIDKIYITEGWNSFSTKDLKIAKSCDVATNYNKWVHSRKDWYNYNNCLEESAYMAKLHDIKEVLTEEERIPKLYKWFKPELPNLANKSYSKKYTPSLEDLTKSVGIWPFAAAKSKTRSPSISWWKAVTDLLIEDEFKIFIFGWEDEPTLNDHPNCISYKHLSYFDQVKASLATSVCIGPDTGAMWVMNAYGHPCVNLLSNYLKNHTKNKLAFQPVGKKGITVFADNDCNNIPIQTVLDTVQIHLREI